MNISEILSDLRERSERITRAINILEGASTAAKPGKRRGGRSGRHMSAAARARISAAMKKRWAIRKKSA